MNLLHLHYFHIVAREGSFTKASELLRIQQPAISRMVKLLEESVGQALFERVGRGVRMTSIGADVFRYSERIFGEVKELEEFLSAKTTTPQGALAFAAADVIASHFLPVVFERLRERAPGLYPQIFSGPAALMFERILSAQLEFGLFFHTPPVPERLISSVINTVRFHLVVRKDRARDREVLEAFIGSREIDDVGTRAFPTLTKLRERWPKASIRISSNQLTAHRELVLRGLGVAVLPEFLVGDDLRQKRVVDVLPKERLEFDLKLVRRRASILSGNASAFLEECAHLK